MPAFIVFSENVTVFYSFVTICNFFCFSQKKYQKMTKRNKNVSIYSGLKGKKTETVCANFTKNYSQKI